MLVKRTSIVWIPALPLLLACCGEQHDQGAVDSAPAVARPGGSVAPPVSLTRPPAGAVAYWSFDESDIDGTAATDGSGNGHHGAILKATLVAGQVGQALDLDGAGGGVDVDGLVYKGRQVSISMWIRKRGDGVRRLLAFNGTMLDGIFQGGIFQVGFTGNDIFVHTGRIGRADFNLPLAPVDIEPDTWTHLAVTWDTAAAADNVKVYVDGLLRVKATLDASKGRDLAINTVQIGHLGDPDSGSQAFAGAIDEVAIYDALLPADRIELYYRQVLSSAGQTLPARINRTIISQGGGDPEPYYPDEPYRGPKKLIRVGSELCSRMLGATSIADADLPARVGQWQDRGLDGLVFTITSHDRGDPDRYWNMTGQWWALTPRRHDEFVPDIRAFQSVKDWGRLTDNFLWSSIAVWQEGRIRCQDWASDEDWRIILENVRLQARIARECGFKGILLDTEQYEGHHAFGAWHIPFSYPNYSEGGYTLNGESGPRPFDAVAATVQQRGTEYARAVCEAFPGLRIMVIPALFEWPRRLGAGPLEDNHNGLYPAFLNGMLLGLDGEATIIGGNEVTYSKTRYIDIGNVRRAYDNAIEALCTAPDHLKSRMSFAAGIWADSGGRWSDSDVSVNVRSPEEHRLAVANAFRASGEYAWLYGEKSFFLTPTPTPLMHRYFQANVDAHAPPVAGGGPPSR